jgi:hypothetical protein
MERIYVIKRKLVKKRDGNNFYKIYKAESQRHGTLSRPRTGYCISQNWRPLGLATFLQTPAIC